MGVVHLGSCSPVIPGPLCLPDLHSSSSTIPRLKVGGGPKGYSFISATLPSTRPVAG